MEPTAEQITKAFADSAAAQLEEGLRIIKNCIAQLNDPQVWWRPAEQMNSIGNLLLHLSGNVRQWLIAGLSETPDLRVRQAEFDDRSNRPATELMTMLTSTVAEARAVLLAQSPERLLAMRRVQQFELNGFGTILGSVTHFQGHVQEIVHLTRCQLGDHYQFLFVPSKDTGPSKDNRTQQSI